MDQVFNELSANGSYANKHEASEGMAKLSALSKSIADLGFSNTLRVTVDCGQRPLAPSYTIHQWGTDASIPRFKDVQRWILTCLTRAPYVHSILESEEGDSAMEFTVDGQVCLGLGLAHLWGCGALSLDSDERFKQSCVAVTYHQVGPNNQLAEDSVEVASWHSASQLQEIEECFHSLCLEGIGNGQQLVDDASKVLPNLAFSTSAIKQLIALTGREQHFQLAIRHLRVINQAMSGWTEGEFSPSGIKWSTESTSTLRRFFRRRHIKCADGKKRLFTNHSKLYSANWRIYFHADTTSRIVHIGYIGPHLPTTRYRT